MLTVPSLLFPFLLPPRPNPNPPVACLRPWCLPISAVGPIVGGVVAGVFIVLLAGGFWWWWVANKPKVSPQPATSSPGLASLLAHKLSSLVWSVRVSSPS